MPSYRSKALRVTQISLDTYEGDDLCDVQFQELESEGYDKEWFSISNQPLGAWNLGETYILTIEPYTPTQEELDADESTRRTRKTEREERLAALSSPEVAYRPVVAA